MTDLIEAIHDYERLTPDALPELKRLMVKYPYFQAPRLLYLYLLNRTDAPDFKNELQDSAVFITDRSGLYSLLNEPDTRENELPETVESDKVEGNVEKEHERSFALIDEFLSEYDDEREPDQNTTIPANANDKRVALDYTAYLEHIGGQEEVKEEKTLSGDSVPIAPRPIPKRTPVQEEKQAEPVEQNDNLSDNYFTETLAKIYVKQGKYSKALEIIQRLYLRNPNKNVYFADQIRYLEKLLINSRNQKNKIK